MLSQCQYFLFQTVYVHSSISLAKVLKGQAFCFQELVAVAYSCLLLHHDVITTLEERGASKSKAHQIQIPDQLLETEGWIGERDIMKKWPPCMYFDISDYQK